MQHAASTQKLAIAALLATTALVVIVGAIWGIRYLTAHRAQPVAPSTDIPLGGFPMAGQLAPDFTLTDQFNHQLTLSSLRGHEVVLAFIDSRCTTLCPLTSNIMYSAKARLSSAEAQKVDLIAINANPNATGVSTVQSWSIAHGMLNQWSFLTGTSEQLWAIYHAYNVPVQIDASGNDAHAALTFIIDAQGHERLYYETLDSKAQIDLKDEEEGLAIGMRQWLPQT